MFPAANTREPDEVLAVCLDAWSELAGSSDADWLRDGFRWVLDAFAGFHPDFEPLDTRYHDLEHTLQGTLCLALLLRGWHRARTLPPPDPAAFRLGLVAILLHDTGYLKPHGDHDGTGAKFTPIHVQRSADFAGTLLARHRYSRSEIEDIQNMIRCTGLDANVRALAFHRPVHRLVGCALATADLLGQMADDDYVDKLPLLFDEFSEAARAHPGIASVEMFASADELIRKTPEFWDHHVVDRLEHEFEGMYRFLNDPWPGGPNAYLDRIEANLEQIGRSPSLRRP